MRKIPVLAVVVFLAGLSPAKEQDASVCLSLRAKGGAVVDVAGRIAAGEIAAENVAFVKDPERGEVFAFGDKPGKIVVPDGGRIQFGKGLTIEAVVKFDANVPEKGFRFAHKDSSVWNRCSFGLDFVKGNKLTLWYMCTADVEPLDYTLAEGARQRQFKPDDAYPGRYNGYNGSMPFPTGQWVRVGFTYNTRSQLGRIWSNGGLDRDFFMPFPKGSPIYDDDKVPLELFAGATNLKVAGLRVLAREKPLAVDAPFRCSTHENAYRGSAYVHVIPTDDDIPLPTTVEVCHMRPLLIGNGFAKYEITDLSERNFRIPPASYGNAESELVVKFSHNGREYYRWSDVLINPSPTCAPYTAFYREDGPHPFPKKPVPDWTIRKDNTIAYRSKPVFPLMLYCARPEELEMLADVGFTMVGLKRDTKLFKPHEWVARVAPCFEQAEKLGITICPRTCDQDGPGRGFAFGLDESFSYNFSTIREYYRYHRHGRIQPSPLPIVMTADHESRYRLTGASCDILAPDPYNNGRSPMRSIYNCIVRAVEAVDDLKPVMCIVGNYGKRANRPNAQELRTMSYMAILGGARALGYYAWCEADERGTDTDTATMPEQIESYRKLFGEFKALEPALTVPNEKEGPVFEPAKPTGFFGCVKKGRDEKTYLIVASDLYRTKERTVAYVPVAGRTAKLLFGPEADVAPAELKFDVKGRAKLKLPQQSVAVYVLEK